MEQNRDFLKELKDIIDYHKHVVKVADIRRNFHEGYVAPEFNSPYSDETLIEAVLRLEEAMIYLLEKDKDGTK